MTNPKKSTDDAEVDFQEFATEIELAVRGVISDRLVAAIVNGSEDGTVSIDTVMLFIDGALSGGLGALADLAWSWCKDDQTIDEVVESFSHVTRSRLRIISKTKQIGNGRREVFE
jgi:hypothetical protein